MFMGGGYRCPFYRCPFGKGAPCERAGRTRSLKWPKSLASLVALTVPILDTLATGKAGESCALCTQNSSGIVAFTEFHR